jgi:hypothetical protein
MRQHLSTLAFAAGAALSAMPAAADTFNLGNLSAISPATASATHSFGALYLGSFTDYFNFSITGDSAVTGTTTEKDGYVKFGLVLKVKDLDVTQVTLQKSVGGSYSNLLPADSSPEAFSFATLATGNYRLKVVGSVLPTVAYDGTTTSSKGISSYTLTAGATAIASPAPEASELLMSVMGLAGVGFWVRRNRRAA